MENDRAHLIGRRTAGSSGNPLIFRLPDGVIARYSIGSFRRADGTLLEGSGIQPDISVEWTVEDFRSGHDPDLSAAQAWIATQTH